MKYLKIHLFGRELLSIEHGAKKPATLTVAAVPTTPSQQQQEGTKPGDVGAGQGLVQERAWSATGRRPIGSSPLGFKAPETD